MCTASLRGLLLSPFSLLILATPLALGAGVQKTEAVAPSVTIEQLEAAASAGELGRFAKGLDDLLLSDTSADLLSRAGSLASGVAMKHLAGPERTAIVSRGIDVLREAIEKDGESFASFAYLSILLRMKAQATAGEQEANDLLAEAAAARERSKTLMVQKGYLAAVRRWEVEILQDGTATVDRRNDLATARINRAPFTIRVRISNSIDVSLNASLTDSTEILMRDGFDFRGCVERGPRFPCPGSGLAREENATWLIPGEDLTLMFSPHAEEKDWTRVSHDGEQWTFERDVTTIGATPISKTEAPELYLVLAIHPFDGPRLVRDDVRAVRIDFR